MLKKKQSFTLPILRMPFCFTDCSFWMRSSFPQQLLELAAEGSPLIPTLGILPSTERPPLRLRPLLVQLENQGQPSNLNLDPFWRTTPNPRAPWGGLETSSALLTPSQRLLPTLAHNLAHPFPFQSQLLQRSWITWARHCCGPGLASFFCERMDSVLGFGGSHVLCHVYSTLPISVWKQPQTRYKWLCSNTAFLWILNSNIIMFTCHKILIFHFSIFLMVGKILSSWEFKKDIMRLIWWAFHNIQISKYVVHLKRI